MFVWRYLDEAGADVGESQTFADRQAAEDWMGEAWSELLQQGIEQVALEDRGAGLRRTVYRMGLREA